MRRKISSRGSGAKSSIPRRVTSKIKGLQKRGALFCYSCAFSGACFKTSSTNAILPIWRVKY
jgi:hypothetical protein